MGMGNPTDLATTLLSGDPAANGHNGSSGQTNRIDVHSINGNQRVAHQKVSVHGGNKRKVCVFLCLDNRRRASPFTFTHYISNKDDH